MNAEGVAPFPGAQLLQVQAVVRHGDRSNIHALPGPLRTRASFLCDSPSAEEVEWAAQLLRPLHSTTECVLLGNTSCTRGAGSALTDGIDRALRAWGIARMQGAVCGSDGGELSSIGWAQLQGIGGGLATAYATLLEAHSDGSVPLQVISTDTGRTALSATALLQGMLKQYGSSNSTNAAAGVSPRGGAVPGGGGAVPPGMQLPLPLHIVSREADPLLWPRKPAVCDRAWQLQLYSSSHMFEHARVPWYIARKIARLAGFLSGGGAHGPGAATGHDGPHDGPSDNTPALEPTPPLSPPSTPGEAEDAALLRVPGTEEVVDDLYSRLCHGYPLPCWHKGGDGGDEEDVEAELSSEAEKEEEGERRPPPSGDDPSDMCLNEREAKDLVMRGDALYGRRFSNQVTNLLTYPALKQMVDMMRRRISSSGNGNGTAARVIVRAAHDTVITPILASLSALDWPAAWPGYASRLLLELWRLPTAPGSTDTNAHAVRLVFNGRDFTHRLSCAVPASSLLPTANTSSGSSGGSGSSSNSDSEAKVCSLEAFAQLVEGFITPYTRWEDACYVAPETLAALRYPGTTPTPVPAAVAATATAPPPPPPAPTAAVGA